MPILHIQLLGEFHLRYGDTPVTGVNTTRLQSLLAYLLLHRATPQSRRHLAFLFWPDATEAQAHSNLRQSLYLLRQVLPDPEYFLAIDGQTVQWRPADGRPETGFTLDVAEFEQAVGQARLEAPAGDLAPLRRSLERAVDLYDIMGAPQGEVLLPDCYDDWITPERERLHRMFIEVGAWLADLLDEQGEYRTAITYAQRLLRHDLLDEVTYQRLMRLYSLSGDRAGALRTYHACVTVLQRELGVEPSPATQAVYQKCLQPGVPVSHGSPTADAPAKSPPQNLPALLTSFIGREQQIAEVQQLLARSRLVTLTGVGGTGKTRLAFQVAARLLDTFPQGTWLVELASLSDPTLVPQAIAAVLGVYEGPGSPLERVLTDFLRPKRLLLILDNCEHLVEASARTAGTILHSCPQVCILATSREILGVAGEIPFAVPSLSVPDAHPLPAVAALLESEAVRLFLDRATLAQPDFTLTPQQAPLVAEICRRLDGIPLAIELAAARVKTMPVDQIVARLDDRFRLLTGGSRTALPRQRTLQSLIDWSFNMLETSEQTLLRRLSIFAGGWTLEAAEAGCAGDGLAAYDVLDLLAQLANKSLVAVETQHGVARYRLLETIRQYAQDKLLESGEGEQVRNRHLEYFLKLAEEGDLKLRGQEQMAWLQRFETEHDNLRAALQWSLQGAPGTQTAELGLRLAGALWWFWNIHGYGKEGRNWCEAVLAHTTASGRTAARAKALLGTAMLTDLHDDIYVARLEESIAIGREVGDKGLVAWALRPLGHVALANGDLAAARARWAESQALFRETGDKWGLAWSLSDQVDGLSFSGSDDYAGLRSLAEESLALFREIGDKKDSAIPISRLGFLDVLQGNYPSARAHFMERLAIEREMGNRINIATSLSLMGQVTLRQGDYGQAAGFIEEGLALNRELGRKWNICISLTWLGEVARAQGDYHRAEALLAESLGLAREIGDKPEMVHGLRVMAGIGVAQGKVARAARLLGAAEISFETARGLQAYFPSITYEQDLAAARAHLGDAAFEAAWAEGLAMTVEQAVTYALDLQVSG
ncbi:MAG: tetratricopeptide repeat protein [Chloroflexi bacterium]|nr:tetratricopeptide repeat protein [Chloroflexota bacterium]